MWIWDECKFHAKLARSWLFPSIVWKIVHHHHHRRVYLFLLHLFSPKCTKRENFFASSKNILSPRKVCVFLNFQKVFVRCHHHHHINFNRVARGQIGFFSLVVGQINAINEMQINFAWSACWWWHDMLMTPNSSSVLMTAAFSINLLDDEIKALTKTKRSSIVPL